MISAEQQVCTLTNGKTLCLFQVRSVFRRRNVPADLEAWNTLPDLTSRRIARTGA